MPPLGFEPTISVLERPKTVRALDRADTAIGSNGNEYQKHTNNISGGVKRGRCVGLTTLLSSVILLANNLGSLTSHKPLELHGLL
jgi:hypothetical protein